MPAPTLDQDQATIAQLRTLLNSGVTKMAGNNRMLQFDLATVREQLAAAEARVATANGCRPQVRRLLTIQYGKGL